MAKFTILYIDRNFYFDRSFIKSYQNYFNKISYNLSSFPLINNYKEQEINEFINTCFSIVDSQVIKQIFEIATHHEFSFLLSEFFFKVLALPNECRSAIIIMDTYNIEHCIWEKDKDGEALFIHVLANDKLPMQFKEVSYANEIDGLLIEKNQVIFDVLNFLKMHNGYKLDLSLVLDFFRRVTFYQKTSVLEFGKYKGCTIQDIINKDIWYIKRCLINLNHFYLERTLMEQLFPNNSGFSFKDNSIRIKKAYENFYWKRINTMINTSTNKSTYKKYNNSHAQRHENLSDGFIDEVLNGDPDAYWNID